MERMPEEHSARDGASRRGTSVECEAELIRLRPAQAASDPRFSQLARMIEQEIIPRLMLAHRALPDPVLRQAGPAYAIGADEVKQFAKLVLSHEEDVAFGAVQSLRARDVSIERIYLDLLAPTARYLGELWEEDLCNFTDVTVGLGRLQRVLRELSPELGKSVDHPEHGRRVLLLPCPGEQHTFGLVMVAEFFRMASWDVTGGAWAADTDAAALVESEWFDVVGFSLGAAVHLSALTDSVRRVRSATCNRDLIILVGGPLFGVHPEFVAQVGADGMSIDGHEAPVLAESLIAANTRHHQSRG
jgi:methanogenic corrinoid protein MtbC1